MTENEKAEKSLKVDFLEVKPIYKSLNPLSVLRITDKEGFIHQFVILKEEDVDKLKFKGLISVYTRDIPYFDGLMLIGKIKGNELCLARIPSSIHYPEELIVKLDK